jgi:hypothetical protein
VICRETQVKQAVENAITNGYCAVQMRAGVAVYFGIILGSIRARLGVMQLVSRR